MIAFYQESADMKMGQKKGTQPAHIALGSVYIPLALCLSLFSNSLIKDIDDWLHQTIVTRSVVTSTVFSLLL